MKKFSITLQIFLALILSVIVGYFLQDYTDFANKYIAPFGTIFLNLLKFIVVPLVILSIMAGVLSMKDVKKVGSLGIKALIYFTLTTIGAIVLGLVVATFLSSYFPVIDLHGLEAVEAPSLTIMDQILDFFPKNIVEPILSTSMMQVIVIALFFGFAIVHVGDKGQPVRELCLSMNEVVTKILSYIMAIAPIGVFCMLTPVVAKDGPEVLGSYAVLIGIAYFCFVLHACIVYAPCVWALGKKNPLTFFKEMVPAMLFAFSSDSSVATLPYTMKCAEKLGVKKDISNFVLSLGATINMDGVAIYLGVTSVFMATCCGIDLTMTQYIAIATSATIASIGTPGIPGGSLALMAMVFASAGIPLECVAIAAGIDRIVDMGRTVMSITGDASCAVVMQQLTNTDTNTDTDC